MRIDPAIAALRADPGLQRQAQTATAAACEAWRGDRAVSAALAELDRFGAGAPLAACPALAALVESPAVSRTLARRLCRELAGALRAEPFGHPPLRHGFDGAVSTLLLARGGGAQLILHAREPGQYAWPSAGFSDAVRYETVLSGAARARAVRRIHGELAFEAIELAVGVRLELDLTSEALQVTAVTRRLVSLRLHRFAARPRPTEERCTASGVLLHRSSGDLAASRHDMMLAVLARMKRADAAPRWPRWRLGTASRRNAGKPCANAWRSTPARGSWRSQPWRAAPPIPLPPPRARCAPSLSRLTRNCWRWRASRAPRNRAPRRDALRA